MQTQILLQVLWYYAYSIIERQKEEKKYAGQEDPPTSPRSINQNLSAHMYHWTHMCISNHQTVAQKKKKKTQYHLYLNLNHKSFQKDKVKKMLAKYLLV